MYNHIRRKFLVLVIGGLGNQLFQYAFALNLKLEHGGEFVLLNENKKHKLMIHKYFYLPYFNFINNFFRSKFISRGRYLNPSIHVSNSLSYDEQVDNIHPGKVIHGFYQSTDYFKTALPILSKEIIIRKKHRIRFAEKYPTVKIKKILCIHIRGKDYISNTKYSLPISYYKKSLSKIEKEEDLSLYRKYVVTDDIEFSKSILSKDLNFEIVSNEPILDFQLMMNSDVLIISNSTFAWWAAFLNSKKNKKVIAPKNWLGYTSEKENPKGIMNVDFIWI